MLNEADTRAKLIDPKLHAAGWGESRITREHYVQRDREFTRGRIYTVGDEGRRKKPKKVDYLLRYSDVLPIAVIEAKDESHSPGDGIQQAKGYAKTLDVLFAYSSNGHGIVEFDFITNGERELAGFPSPEELWNRLGMALKIRPDELPQRVRESRARYGLETGEGERSNPYLSGYCPKSSCGKEPFYFQEIAINRTIQSIMQGQRRLLLNMATGTGKTFVAFQIVWKLVKSGWLRRVLFLADRNLLRDNAYNTFGPFEDARLPITEGKVNLNRDIYFSTYQAMWSGEEGERLFQQYPSDFFDLIIIDECHRSGFGTWNEILKHFPNAIQLGMTATPKRTDNIDTYDYFCRENNGEPTYSYSLGQGIEDGFLATYKVHLVRTNVDKDGLHIHDAAVQGAEIYVPEGAELRDVYLTPQFEREITLPDRIERMSEHLAGLLRTFGPMQKTMVFCVDMNHAREVAHHLQNHFAHLGHSNYAVRIVSEEPDARELFEQFQDSDRQTPVVATTADLLTTGVDVPSAKNIVFMKTVSSPVVFKQILGRGSRTDSATEKLWFRIIDYTNATRLLDSWDRPPGPPPEPDVGPRICGLNGKVVHIETGDPIPEALVTVITRPNEQVQARTDLFGQFSFKGLPEGSMTVIVNASGFRRKQLKVETVEDTVREISIELRPEGVPVGKIRVKGLEVVIADEALFIIENTGQTMNLEQYKDYTRQMIFLKSPSPDTLREIWTDADKRRAFLDALERESVRVEILAEVLDQRQGDQFDILAHIAFGRPIHTRDERADAFVNRQGQFIKSYGEEAREVILALLDKYRLGGVDELSRPEVFRIPPFDAMGMAPGVIRRFGDVNALRAAMSEMQRRLYPVEEAA